MDEALYAGHPEAYDALYAEKEYDAEVEYVLGVFDRRVHDAAEIDRPRALVAGCGTGEHAKRLRENGLDVVGMDRYPAMVYLARTKSDAEFCVGALPDLPVDGEFDLVWFPFTVVQHLPPKDAAQSLRAATERLADGGILVFDQITAEHFGDAPYLKTYPSEEGPYARLTQVHDVGDGESRYEALVFTPDGEFFVDTHRLFAHDPEFFAEVCDVLDLSLARRGWYDEESEPGEEGHTVFVAQKTD